jgi:hypothetical protein
MDRQNVLRVPEVAESQNWEIVEYWFTDAAAGTPYSLLAPQQIAAGKVFCVLGDGAVDLTQAQANEFVKSAAGTIDNQFSTNPSAIASDLVVYGTNCPINKVTFIIGGFAGPQQIHSAELTYFTAPGGAKKGAIVVGPALACDKSTNPTAASNPLVFFSEVGVCAGVINVTGALPSAGDIVVLKVLVKG